MALSNASLSSVSSSLWSEMRTIQCCMIGILNRMVVVSGIFDVFDVMFKHHHMIAFNRLTARANFVCCLL